MTDPSPLSARWLFSLPSGHHTSNLMAKFNSLGSDPQALCDQHNSCLCKLNICSKNNLVYRSIGPWCACMALCPRHGQGRHCVLVCLQTKMRKHLCHPLTVAIMGELHKIAQTNLSAIKQAEARLKNCLSRKIWSWGQGRKMEGWIVFLFSFETEEEICFYWSIIYTLQYLAWLMPQLVARGEGHTFNKLLEKISRKVKWILLSWPW